MIFRVILIILNINRPFWTHLKFLDQFGRLWTFLGTILSHIGPLLTNMDHFGSFNIFRSSWIIFDHLGQFLNHYGKILTIFDNFITCWSLFYLGTTLDSFCTMLYNFRSLHYEPSGVFSKSHISENMSHVFSKASALWADAFYKSICPSVCLYICVNVFLHPLPEVGCPIFLEIRNPWGKVMERSGLTFEHFFGKLSKIAAQFFFFLLILPYKTWWKPRFPMD